ncbi:unnamed protein product [Didymodactylos carnosus]|uniref:Phytanoyl-CoA dioxygenase n=1 Tax=Didymodactylos carnosus TaxID=1234261 RepID=A0A814USW1_9BILA|nr:unnamed protein product [Didymodactylos carnosus]CAF1203946.1 unnamed protein product [Didymodactylos carnosus]CAF3943973.1 unnamed protein product [Didymodactylos carnosus]CAF4013608.1 unnamed protein product [Didymodactylos carnosus]
MPSGDILDRSFYPPLSSDILSWIREFTPGPLTPDELNQFYEDGFVLKPNLLTKEQLDSVINGLERLVDELAQELFKAGKINDLCENIGFYQRLTAIESQFPAASVLLHKRGILPAEIAALWSCDALLGVAKQLLGTEIAGHPVWNIRTKVPHQEQATVPWHQDTAYLNPECWKTLQVTAWIPLLDANLENGCMQLLRGGHRPGVTCAHNCCAGGTWYVELPEENMSKTLGIPVNEKSVITCEVPFGSVLFLNNLIPHKSLENYSNNIRWSLDLRWQKPNEPNGFYGLKENIVMAKGSDLNYKPDWNEWSKINRSKLQEAAVQQHIKDQIPELKNKVESDPFDTTIAGPWMNNWPIVHHNRHTAALTTNETNWHKS